MTPIISIETIITAMMCLCSSHNNDSYYDAFSNIAGKFNYKQDKQPVVLVKPAEISEIRERLLHLDLKFAELQRNQQQILAAIERIQSPNSMNDNPKLRLELAPQQSCPENSAQEINEIITLKIPTHNDIFPVLCTGPVYGSHGWLVIAQRFDGSEDFYRSWAEYRQGFGTFSGEFFLGLNKLHALTKDGSQELLIVLEDFENDRRFARYERFELGDESEGFVLKVLGEYSGTAGDSLRHHVSHKFTTYDMDNDENKWNCANEYTGAWWYVNCHVSNLFGQYLSGSLLEEKYAKGMSWETYRGLRYSLKSIKMMIKTKKK